jgi:hypothetical protein
MWFGGRVKQSKKVVDDGNLTYFIIRYRYGQQEGNLFKKYFRVLSPLICL